MAWWDFLRGQMHSLTPIQGSTSRNRRNHECHPGQIAEIEMVAWRGHKCACVSRMW